MFQVTICLDARFGGRAGAQYVINLMLSLVDFGNDNAT
jgi:hypothetical protein